MGRQLQLSKRKFKLISKAILEVLPEYIGYPTPYRFIGVLPKLSIHYSVNSSYCGYYDNNNIMIRIYPKCIRSKFDHIRTIIHEYTHYVQMYDNQRINYKYTKLNDSLGYENNPFEIEARENETKYMRLIYNRIKHLF